MRPEKLRSFDLNLLVIADALLETRSVTEAAEIVHLSQPAVSRALGRLREMLGDPLLIRERRTMRLTPYGRQLQPRLRSALLQLERVLLDRDAFDPSTARGTLTIACADYATVAFMPGALQRLAEDAPQLTLVLAPYVEPFEALLESGDCDLVVGHRASDKSWIESQPLFESGWCCVARRDHPWLGDGSLDGYCRAKHVMVSPRGQGAGPVDVILQRLGRERHIATRVPDFAGALATAAQTDLLLSVPERLAAAAGRVAALDHAPLPFDVGRSRVYLSWHAANHDDERSQWTRRMVADVVALADEATA